MTEYPAPPPPKSTNWKVIIPVVIIVILICICLVVVGILAYMGTQGKGPLAMLATATPTATNTRIPTSTPTKTPTKTPESASVLGTWDLYYDWSCDGDYAGPATITFYNDYSFSIYEGTGDTAYGTWYTYGDTMDFIFDESPNSHYIGTIYSDGYMEGTMDNTSGSSGCWYAEKGTSGDGQSITGDWDLYYDWSCDGGYSGPAWLTFYDDYSFYLSEDSGDLTGTWYAVDEYIDFMFDEYPYAHYVGTLFSEYYMEGTMETDDDQSGCWYAER